MGGLQFQNDDFPPLKIYRSKSTRGRMLFSQSGRKLAVRRTLPKCRGRCSSPGGERWVRRRPQARTGAEWAGRRARRRRLGVPALMSRRQRSGAVPGLIHHPACPPEWACPGTPASLLENFCPEGLGPQQGVRWDWRGRGRNPTRGDSAGNHVWGEGCAPWGCVALAELGRRPHRVGGGGPGWGLRPWAVCPTSVHLHRIRGARMSFLQVFLKLSQTWGFSASCLPEQELGWMAGSQRG